MALDVGPTQGNGFIWQKGPFTIGLWVQPDQGGVGEPLVLGHLSPSGWTADAVVMMDEPAGWQNLINVQAGGLIGKYYIVNLLPRINAIADQLFVINPHAGTPVQNTEPYSKDTFNAMIAQYTKVDAAGRLVQGP